MANFGPKTNWKLFGNKKCHNFTQIRPEIGRKSADFRPEKAHRAFGLWRLGFPSLWYVHIFNITSVSVIALHILSSVSCQFSNLLATLMWGARSTLWKNWVLGQAQAGTRLGHITIFYNWLFTANAKDPEVIKKVRGVWVSHLKN